MDDTAATSPIATRDPPLPSHVRRAITFMRENIGEKITLAELSSACAIPERTLLRQFQRFVGLAPLAYLRRLRLNTARTKLVRPDNDNAISDIAIRCGFTHLGRFSSEYRRLFDETPSATRQRARAPAASIAAHSSASWPNRERPLLLILPLHTDTLQESREARDLNERLAATLSRTRIASVELAHPSRSLALNAPQPRNAGTEYVLRGRLTQRGACLRVIVRLVDMATDRHLWGDSFDGAVNDLFELQDRVVDAVLCGVVSHITDAEIERACEKDPKDVTAGDLAVQALPLILGTSVTGARKAMAILNHALDVHPAGAASMALLACCHAQLATYHGTPYPAVNRNSALELSRRAGVLDNSDPLVTAARSTATALALQPVEADALATRALAMDPTSAWAWERRGFLRLNSPADADVAITDFRRALQFRGPRISRANCFVGIASAHCKAGRLDATDLWTRRAIAENPTATWLYRWQSCYAAKMGDRRMVADAVEKLRRAQPELTVSLLVASFPPSDPGWLDALARAGMPL
jgi:AraC-like DNA-binding protein